MGSRFKNQSLSVLFLFALRRINRRQYANPSQIVRKKDRNYREKVNMKLIYEENDIIQQSRYLYIFYRIKEETARTRNPPFSNCSTVSYGIRIIRIHRKSGDKSVTRQPEK